MKEDIKFLIKLIADNQKLILTVCALVGLTNAGTAYTVTSEPVIMNCGKDVQIKHCLLGHGKPVISKWNNWSLEDCIYQ